MKLVDSAVSPDSVAEVMEACAGAAVLGISMVTGPMITQGVEVAQAARRRYPDLAIVAGGWHASILPEQTLRSPCFDAVVRGQGEITFAEMVERYARGERDLDQCADLYALAAIAYRALTGEPPFSGRMPTILKNIAEDMPRAPSSFLDLPRHVDYVLAIGLAKERRHRFQTAFEFSAAFAMAAGNNLNSSITKRAKELLAALPYAK